MNPPPLFFGRDTDLPSITIFEEEWSRLGTAGIEEEKEYYYYFRKMILRTSNSATSRFRDGGNS